MEISHRSRLSTKSFPARTAACASCSACRKTIRFSFCRAAPVCSLRWCDEFSLSLDESADYIVTGSWGKKAVKEAQKFGNVNYAANTADGGFTRVPGQDEARRSTPARLTSTSLRMKRSKASSLRANLKSARCRWCATHLRTFFRGLFPVEQVRPDLRRSAKEHGPQRRNPGHQSAKILLPRRPRRAWRRCSTIARTPKTSRSTTRRIPGASTSSIWSRSG